MISDCARKKKKKKKTTTTKNSAAVMSLKCCKIQLAKNIQHLKTFNL